VDQYQQQNPYPPQNQSPAQGAYPPQNPYPLQTPYQVPHGPLGAGSEQCPHCMTWNFPGATTCTGCHASKETIYEWRAGVVLATFVIALGAAVYLFARFIGERNIIFAIFGAGISFMVVIAVGLMVGIATRKPRTVWIKARGF
jgi:hypothetical protein